MSQFEDKKNKQPHESTGPSQSQSTKADVSAPSQRLADNILRLQRTVGNREVTALLQSMPHVRGEGRPLSEDLRAGFETRFASDFSKVRIHTGGDAAESARALNADAYAVGQDLVFDTGKFNPQSQSGQHLLAHELAHVVQQSRGGDAPATFDSSSSIEHGAHDAASQFVQGAEPRAVSGASSPGIARQEKPDTPPEPVHWLGTPPVSVRLAQARDMKKKLEELRKTDPNATMLDVPMPKDPTAPTAEDLLGFDPLRPLPEFFPTEFEKKLQGKQPVTVHDEHGDLVYYPEDVVQVRDRATGDILLYHTIKGATYYVLDREGKILSTTNLESPLETPVIDPIDVVLFVADVGPMVAKGISAGGKAISASIAKNALREASEVGAARVIGRTPAEAANELMSKYAGRLVDSNDALAGIIERARHSSLRVDGRAAATELRGIIDILEDGIGGRSASRVEVIPASNAGRTPDLVIHFADGSTTRYEMRTITSAPRGHVTPKAGSSPGALARGLAEATAERPVSRSQISQAILDKAKVTPTRPSQLTAPIPGVAPGGTISVNITAATTSSAVIDDAVQSVAGRLGPHVEEIRISYLMPRSAPTDPLTRGTLRYVRQPAGNYIRVP
jgi:hypothetical protein